MDLEFEKPYVPNFIRTKQGVFPLEQLTKQEIEEYITFFTDTLRQSHQRKSKGSFRLRGRE